MLHLTPAQISAANDMQDASNCPLCSLTLRSPYSTNCGHNFCKRCLNAYFLENEIACPTCGLQQNLEVSIKENKLLGSACLLVEELNDLLGRRIGVESTEVVAPEEEEEEEFVRGRKPPMKMGEELNSRWGLGMGEGLIPRWRSPVGMGEELIRSGKSPAGQEWNLIEKSGVGEELNPRGISPLGIGERRKENLPNRQSSSEQEEHVAPLTDLYTTQQIEGKRQRLKEAKENLFGVEVFDGDETAAAASLSAPPTLTPPPPTQAMMTSIPATAIFEDLQSTASQTPKVIITMSGISRERQRVKQLECLLGRLGGEHVEPSSELLSQDDAHVERPTHVVVEAKSDENGNWNYRWTFKYFWGVSNGSHIVREAWLDECERAGRWVDAEPYSVLPPGNKEAPKLFYGLSFFLGPFPRDSSIMTFSKWQAKELLELNGAIVRDVGGTEKGDGVFITTAEANCDKPPTLIVGHPRELTHANNSCSFCDQLYKLVPENIRVVESAWIMICLKERRLAEYGNRQLIP